VNRAEFVSGTIAALAAPIHANKASAGITAVVTLSREGSALLAPFLVAIALHNPTGRVVRLKFPTADLFRVDVLLDDTPVWSSATQHKPIPITRQLDVPPGPLKLAQQLVDGTTDDHRAFKPGRYIVRVAMLATGFGVLVDNAISFDAPTTIAQALVAKPGAVTTVAGVPYIDGGIPRLRDATGTMRLSHALGIAVSGTWIVRGFPDADGDERVFDIGRAAPSWDNAPSPKPML
jgi:hypothetical protein